MKTMIYWLLLLFILSGCSTHNSTLKMETGSQQIYLISEAKVFKSVYNVLTDIYPKQPVFDIDGPIRGFCVRRRLGPDEYITMVRIFPAQGYDKSDRTVTGYYVEVSGEGTLFDGPSKDNKAFKKIVRELGKLSNPLAVRDVERGEYQLERDRWKLKDSELSNGSQSPKTGEDEIKNRLLKLEELLKVGLITEDEYAKKRQEILSKL